MSGRPLEIDLRGKSFDEVAELLERSGFSIHRSDVTHYWDAHKKVADAPVRAIFIEDDGAPELTVTIFDGKKITRKPGEDLHLFDRPPGRQPGQDWSVVHTLNLMR